MTVSLVTGAGGFVGSHLCRVLEAAGIEVHRVSGDPEIGPGRIDLRVLEPSEAAIAEALGGVDVIYHLAGVAHEAVAGSEADLMRRVNVEAPLRWLRAADRAGVRRFVWLSSIKVLGDESTRPLRPDDAYRPGDGYAAGKADAERRLLAEPLSSTRLAVVRPPLVYGSGVKGNFLTLLRLGASPLPLPLARATAPRSLVGVDNLCDLLVRLAQDGEGIFHVADAADWQVAELLATIRRLLGRPAWQFPVPPRALERAARLLGREAAWRRLFQPLQVDTSATRTRLGWAPPCPALEQLEDTVAWFRKSR